MVAGSSSRGPPAVDPEPSDEGIRFGVLLEEGESAVHGRLRPAPRLAFRVRACGRRDEQSGSTGRQLWELLGRRVLQQLNESP